jgi:hypothetical protein
MSRLLLAAALAAALWIVPELDSPVARGVGASGPHPDQLLVAGAANGPALLARGDELAAAAVAGM